MWQPCEWCRTTRPWRPTYAPILLPLTAAAAAHPAGDLDRFNELWTPDSRVQLPAVEASSGAPGAAATGGDDHKPRTPPPDLPSLLLDSRICYLGMPVRAAAADRGVGSACVWAEAGRLQACTAWAVL